MLSGTNYFDPFPFFWHCTWHHFHGPFTNSTSSSCCIRTRIPFYATQHVEISDYFAINFHFFCSLLTTLNTVHTWVVSLCRLRMNIYVEINFLWDRDTNWEWEKAMEMNVKSFLLGKDFWLLKWCTHMLHWRRLMVLNIYRKRHYGSGVECHSCNALCDFLDEYLI